MEENAQFIPSTTGANYMKEFCLKNATRPLGLLVLGLCLCGAPAARAADEVPYKKITTIEGITEYRLNNGMKVLLYPDKSSARVTVNMTILVGSRHEGYGETGMAHLLEHMVFKGTPTFTDVPKALRDHGADFNGTTWVDRTNYFESMPANDENLEFGIKLEADRLINSFIKREDLLSEMTVVRNEFEAGENSPDAILSQRMMAIAFEWHNYGKSTIGSRADIEKVPIENLQAFYRKYYQPDNAVLIIAGRFEEKKALELITKYCAPLKKPGRELGATYTEEPAQDGEREVILRRVGKVGIVGTMYHVPAASHDDFAAVEVMNQILVSEPTGRLYTALVKAKKATQVGGAAFGWHDPGVIELGANLDTGDEKAIYGVRDILIDVTENFYKTDITKEEVDRARQKLLKNRELQLNDANRIGVALSEWTSKGDWRLFFLHRDRLEKVKPEDVKRVAEAYLKRSNRTVGLYIPTEKSQRTPIPEAAKLADVLKDYKGREAVVTGEAFDPTPENIDKRTKTSELPSGVKAALLNKKTTGEAVNGRLTLRFGNAESLKGNSIAIDYLASLMERGAEGMTYEQIVDAMDKLNARLGFSSSAGALTVTFTCKKSTLPDVLKLAQKILREPTFPADELEILKRQQLEELEKEKTEPIALAQRALRRKIDPQPKDSIRYVPTVEEEIDMVKALKVDDIKKLYKEQIGGTAGELVLVGEFDEKAAVEGVNAILKDWKSKVNYAYIEHTAKLDVKGEVININTPDKANAVYISAHTLALKDSDPDYAAVQLANFVFGEAPLASRLSNRVRGQEGLSYGIGSQVQGNPRDKSGIFLMFAITNPVNIDKVDKLVGEELGKILKDGLTAKELEEAKGAYQKMVNVNRSKDSALVGMLATNLFVGRTAKYQADMDKKRESVTLDEVNGAFKKIVEPKRLVTIRAGDFTKKSETPKPEK